MKIKRAWIEFEDEDGKAYMAPATPEDLKAILDAQGNPEAAQTPTGNEMPAFNIWEPGPGYTLEEIAAQRATSGELRGVAAR